MLCGCVLPTGAGCTVIIYTGACALYFRLLCACGTVFGLDSPNSVSCTCMCACTAVGTCSPSVVLLACTEYAMDSLGGVRSLHEGLCVRTVLGPRVQCFGIDSPDNASILRRSACLGVTAVREQPGWRT